MQEFGRLPPFHGSRKFIAGILVPLCRMAVDERQ